MILYALTLCIVQLWSTSDVSIPPFLRLSQNELHRFPSQRWINITLIIQVKPVGHQNYKGDSLGADLGSALRSFSSPQVLRGAASQNRDKWKMSSEMVGKIKWHKASPSSSQWALTSIDLELVRHANLSHIQKGIIDHTISCCDEEKLS